MSVLLANIADSLLPQLEGKSEQEKWETCAKDFPWYPMPWLVLAKNGDTVSKQKAAVWLEDGQRLHFLLNANSYSQDVWLLKNFDTVEENTLTAKILPEKEPAAPLAPTDIFLTDAGENQPIEPAKITQEEGVDFPQKFTLSGKFEQEEETAEEEDANDTDFVSKAENDAAPLIINLSKNDDNQFLGKNIKTEVEDKIVDLKESLEHVSADKIANNIASIEPTESFVAGEVKEETVIAPAANLQEKSVAEPLAFEPYHVVDYFASQGIKVDINDIPKTQLDRQMKSFTQWLKTMKKVAPTQDSTAPTDPVVDAQATSSLIKEDVITEAMAEVLEKQGMYKKAVEVYEKLILLHPEKSTFFAARIKDLKSK